MDLVPLLQVAGYVLSLATTYHLALRRGGQQQQKADRDAQKEASDTLWSQLSQQLAELGKRLEESESCSNRLRRKLRALSARTEELEDLVGDLRRQNKDLRHQQQVSDEVIEELRAHVTLLQQQVKELGSEPAPPPNKEPRKRGTPK